MSQNGERMEEYAVWWLVALVLAVAVLASLRGWYGVALVAVGLAAGPYLGRGISSLARGRKTLGATAVAVATLCAVLAVSGFGGLLGSVRIGEVRLWGPLLALLSTTVLGLLLEGERRKDGEKLRMMLDLYPHPDGGRWDGERMEGATGGVVTAGFFEALREGRGTALGPPFEEIAAIARVMDFPLELWYRKLGWWEKVYRDRRGGADVSERLYEWDCATPETAARRLGVSPEDILEMVNVGELEGRRDREGGWQIRECRLFEQEMQRRGQGHVPLPSHPRNSRSGRTGAGRFSDHKGKPLRGRG